MRWKLLLGFVAAVLLAVVAYERSGAVDRVEVDLPRELSGRWVTQSPRFADRFLVITPTEIVFGRGADGESRHRIESVWIERPRRDWTVYVLRHGGTENEPEGGEMTLLLRDGRLRFESTSDIVWTLAP